MEQELWLEGTFEKEALSDTTILRTAEVVNQSAQDAWQALQLV